MKYMLYPALEKQVKEFEEEFSSIPNARKRILQQLATFIQQKQKATASIDLNFICTHNSRRSHIAQLWAQVGAAYYRIDNVRCFSGGTEATAFNSRAVKAMKTIGFEIKQLDESANPKYEVSFSEMGNPPIAFSKVYTDSTNPSRGFAAILTCSHADENCPLVVGAEARISLPYDDPKDFDGTELEQSKYQERVLEIGREICFAFSLV
jgi:arsenate reductase (thioredoxin)